MNKKGFTLVEIITTFALAAVILVLLINVVVMIKNIYTNTSTKTELLINQANLSNVLNSKIGNENITSYTNCTDQTDYLMYYNFTLSDGSSIDLKVSDYKITFGDFVYNLDDSSEISNYYLIKDSDFLNINITIENKLFPDYDFGVNLVHSGSATQNYDTSVCSSNDETGDDDSSSVIVDNNSSYYTSCALSSDEDGDGQYSDGDTITCEIKNKLGKYSEDFYIVTYNYAQMILFPTTYVYKVDEHYIQSDSADLYSFSDINDIYISEYERYFNQYFYSNATVTLMPEQIYNKIGWNSIREAKDGDTAGYWLGDFSSSDLYYIYNWEYEKQELARDGGSSDQKHFRPVIIINHKESEAVCVDKDSGNTFNSVEVGDSINCEINAYNHNLIGNFYVIGVSDTEVSLFPEDFVYKNEGFYYTETQGQNISAYDYGYSLDDINRYLIYDYETYLRQVAFSDAKVELLTEDKLIDGDTNFEFVDAYKSGYWVNIVDNDSTYNYIYGERSKATTTDTSDYKFFRPVITTSQILGSNSDSGDDSDSGDSSYDATYATVSGDVDSTSLTIECPTCSITGGHFQTSFTVDLTYDNIVFNNLKIITDESSNDCSNYGVKSTLYEMSDTKIDLVLIADSHYVSQGTDKDCDVVVGTTNGKVLYTLDVYLEYKTD